MSISSDDCNAQALDLLGAQAVLLKPVDEAVLLDLLRRVVAPGASRPPTLPR
jgi:hypothetical protein